MLNRVSFLNKCIIPAQVRAMSTASIRDRFEAAYQERTANIAKNPKKT